MASRLVRVELARYIMCFVACAECWEAVVTSAKPLFAPNSFQALASAPNSRDHFHYEVKVYGVSLGIGDSLEITGSAPKPNEHACSLRVII
ncbi:hypothetical protein C2E23DRAFT_815536 [Lenzites betulinus]|nr:hypothetical protein C2E23DRAFT_815536 [Lenzites betulinus]